jgi:hypothetical protein
MTRQGTRRLDYLAVSKTSCFPPKHSGLPERDKPMSEQQQKPKSFMEELDEWSNANVISPLLDTLAEDLDNVEEEVKKAIRAKVLQSYRNGRQAGPKPAPAMARRSAVPGRR